MKKVTTQYFCDLCGEEFEELHEIHIHTVNKVYAYEWGYKDYEKPEIHQHKLEVCLDCAEKATNIREKTKFYQPSEFYFKEEK